MALRLLALALTALVVIPSGAHFFEMFTKLKLPRDEYFVAQQIYAGWALFAVPILAAIAANLAVYAGLRHADRRASHAALGAAALIAASLALFLLVVFPTNQATANWTEIPDGWESLRLRWELGHAVNFGLVFLALLLSGRALAARA